MYVYDIRKYLYCLMLAQAIWAQAVSGSSAASLEGSSGFDISSFSLNSCNAKVKEKEMVGRWNVCMGSAHRLGLGSPPDRLHRIAYAYGWMGVQGNAMFFKHLLRHTKEQTSSREAHAPHNSNAATGAPSHQSHQVLLPWQVACDHGTSISQFLDFSVSPWAPLEAAAAESLSLCFFGFFQSKLS